MMRSIGTDDSDIRDLCTEVERDNTLFEMNNQEDIKRLESFFVERAKQRNNPIPHFKLLIEGIQGAAKDDLVVAPTPDIRGELALYTTRKIKQGEIIIEYAGKQLTEKEFSNKTTTDDYTLEIINKETGKIYYIDGRSPAMFANHSNDDPSALIKNVIIESSTTKPCLVARREIPAGEPITYNYGDSHFDETKIDLPTNPFFSLKVLLHAMQDIQKKEPDKDLLKRTATQDVIQKAIKDIKKNWKQKTNSKHLENTQESDSSEESITDDDDDDDYIEKLSRESDLPTEQKQNINIQETSKKAESLNNNTPSLTHSEKAPRDEDLILQLRRKPKPFLFQQKKFSNEKEFLKNFKFDTVNRITAIVNPETVGSRDSSFEKADNLIKHLQDQFSWAHYLRPVRSVIKKKSPKRIPVIRISDADLEGGDLKELFQLFNIKKNPPKNSVPIVPFHGKSIPDGVTLLRNTEWYWTAEDQFYVAFNESNASVKLSNCTKSVTDLFNAGIYYPLLHVQRRIANDKKGAFFTFDTSEDAHTAIQLLQYRHGIDPHNTEWEEKKGLKAQPFTGIESIRFNAVVPDILAEYAQWRHNDTLVIDFNNPKAQALKKKYTEHYNSTHGIDSCRRSINHFITDKDKSEKLKVNRHKETDGVSRILITDPDKDGKNLISFLQDIELEALINRKEEDILAAKPLSQAATRNDIIESFLVFEDKQANTVKLFLNQQLLDDRGVTTRLLNPGWPDIVNSVQQASYFFKSTKHIHNVVTHDDSKKTITINFFTQKDWKKLKNYLSKEKNITLQESQESYSSFVKKQNTTPMVPTKEIKTETINTTSVEDCKKLDTPSKSEAQEKNTRTNHQSPKQSNFRINYFLGKDKRPMNTPFQIEKKTDEKNSPVQQNSSYSYRCLLYRKRKTDTDGFLHGQPSEKEGNTDEKQNNIEQGSDTGKNKKRKYSYF